MSLLRILLFILGAILVVWGVISLFNHHLIWGMIEIIIGLVIAGAGSRAPSNRAL